VLEKEFGWVSFVGAKVRAEFSADYSPASSDRSVESSYPEVNEELFEWLDLVAAIEEARGCFTMIELGAGYGRWMVNAALFAEQFRPGLAYRMVGVEAEANHFHWIERHVLDNGLDPSRFEAVHAAVGKREGVGYINLAAPIDSYGEKCYSTRLQAEMTHSIKFLAGHVIPGRRIWARAARFARVPVIELSRLVARQADVVDLLDFDIQGAEGEVIRGAIDALDERVRRVHVATHSRANDRVVEAAFERHGWERVWGYPWRVTSATPYGPVYFGDGLQSWKNPRLRSPRADRPVVVAHDVAPPSCG
jgi:FkbM family methyltransferase